MPEEVPTLSRGVYILLKFIALGCVLTGIDEIDKNNYLRGFGEVAVGGIFFFVGLFCLRRYFNKRTSNPGMSPGRMPELA